MGAEAGAGRPRFSSVKAGPTAGSGHEHAVGKPPSDRRAVGAAWLEADGTLWPALLPQPQAWERWDASLQRGLWEARQQPWAPPRRARAAGLDALAVGRAFFPQRARGTCWALAGKFPCGAVGCGVVGRAPQASGKEKRKPVNWKHCFVFGSVF